MAKLIALLNVIAWSGFWAFGYLALTSGSDTMAHGITAILLAAAGGAFGMWAFLWLVRHSERTGYAKPRNRAVVPQEEIA